jgi:hypothetical protein
MANSSSSWKSFVRIVHLALEPHGEKYCHADDEKNGEQAQEPDAAVEQEIEYDVHLSLPFVVERMYQGPP